MGAICPYCQRLSNVTDIIDSGHRQIHNFKAKLNIRHIYLCKDCGEVFEAHQKKKQLQIPVDIYFKRKFQYLRTNLKIATFKEYEDNAVSKFKVLYDD